MRHEDAARIKIDSQLKACGWQVQDYPNLDLSSAGGIAVREFPLKVGHGAADYLLYVNRCAVGVVEAKKEGETLTGVEVQTEKYSHGLPQSLPAVDRPLPWLYQSTGVETRFTNARDPDAVSRDIYSFHRPEFIAKALGLKSVQSLLVEKEPRPLYLRTLLGRLRALPPIETEGLRDCQIEAITNLEQSLAANRRRALVQMQTGSGKTTFAVAEAYRLIKFGGAERILFLVDRSNLARQTLKEFQQYTTPDDGRKFTELYNVQHLQSNRIDPVCKVVITTIQRLYSILQGEAEFDPEREEESVAAGLAALRKEPLPVVYNPQVPIETFDFVFTDECHRSIYNLWRQVLEYFDSYLIGLTATPSKQTLGFFNQNLVMEYGHAQAVTDGVNVDFDVYRIQTRVTSQGATVTAGNVVDRRDRKTRKRRWEELDDDLTYRPNDLDRAVVSEDQIRTVVRTFRDRLFTEIFPGRTEVPKTLIFAKDDSHADDIVRIVREEFGKGNVFCEKITYRTSTARIVDPATGAVTYKSTGLTPESLLSSFRNAYHPRIAVTVDMIATGTDVKPLEIVFFMRDVQSSNYFEQMKGRGCRVLTPTEFRNVTPDGVNKTRYVIVDAIGVTEHLRSDSPPLERQPTVPLKSVLQAVAAGSTDAEVVSTLASRMSRLDKILVPGQRQEIERLAGASMHDLIHALVQSIDPDAVEAASRRLLADQEAVGRRFYGDYLNPLAPIEFLSGNLPHWRQEGVTYFVTFRLADSLPADKLNQWQEERGAWMHANPPPLSSAQEADYHQRFSARFEHWLDQGAGSCVLEIPECRAIVEGALAHFDGERYTLGEYVVAANHVHAIVAPKPGHELSQILHSWKSFTSKAIAKVEAASRRLQPFWQQLAHRGDHRGDGVPPSSDHAPSPISGGTPLPLPAHGVGVPPSDPGSSGVPPLLQVPRTVWQKESYDHIVRSAEDLERICRYIRNHEEHAERLVIDAEQLRRDAAATMAAEAVTPFHKADLRNYILSAQQDAEQTIDTATRDEVLFAGGSVEATEKARTTINSFRRYIEEHRDEITALQLLYSRRRGQAPTLKQLKELSATIALPPRAWTPEALWRAYEALERDRVRGHGGKAVADLVSLIRFALEQETILRPFGETVGDRFTAWLAAQEQAGRRFSAEERRWLEMIRDHIAASLTIEPDDFDLAPFNQQGGLGRAYAVFGERLEPLLQELNEVLAA